MAPLQQPSVAYNERSANGRPWSRTAFPLPQRPIPAKNPQPPADPDVVASQSPASPYPYTVPYTNRAAGPRQSGGSHRSTQSTLPDSSSENRSLLSHHDLNAVERPDVVISSVPDTGHQYQACEGHPCLFYGQNPLGYPQCHASCTAHGADEAHYIRRHLKKHHLEHVESDILDAAIAKLTVKDKTNKSLDNRRHSLGQKVLLKDRVVEMYKRARNELFGTEESQSIPRCRLPKGHVPPRQRLSNRTSDAMSERGSQNKRQRPNSLTMSQASSVTNLGSSSNVGGGSTRTGGSYLSLDDGDASLKQMHMHRIEGIRNRLVGFLNFTSGNKRSDPSLLDVFERIEAVLNQWEKRSYEGLAHRMDSCAPLPDGDEQTRASRPTTGGSGLNHTYDSESHLYLGGGQSLHNAQHDMDLAMLMGVGDPAVLPNPTLSARPLSEPHVPSQHTWQEQIFADRDLSTQHSMEIDRVSETPEPVGNIGYPPTTLVAASPLPTLTSLRAQSSRPMTYSHFPRPSNRPRTERLHEPPRNVSTANFWLHQQQYSSQYCQVCGRAICECM